ncbi:MAG: ABC transporter substrate-binding protein [Halobacteriaceae archaeon]
MASVVASGGLAGCSGQQGGTTPTPAQDKAETQQKDKTETTQQKQLKAKLAISHYPTIPGTVPVQVAKKKGIFEKYGITKAPVTSFSGGGTTVRGVVTGNLTIGSTALLALIRAFQAGAPIHLVGLMQRSPDILFDTLPDSPIETIQDVKGKTIAISNPGSSSMQCAILSIKAANGISRDDVTLMAAGGLGEALTALQEGSADVAWNIPPKSTIMHQKGKTRQVWHTRTYAPQFPEIPLGMGAQTLNEQFNLARSTLRALIDAMKFVQNNVEESARIWAKTAGISEDLAISALKETKPDKMFGPRIYEDGLKDTVSVLLQTGDLKNRPDWAKFINQSALPKQYRSEWVPEK